MPYTFKLNLTKTIISKQKNQMKKTLLTLILIFCLSMVMAQESTTYPKGIYETYKDYIIGKPSDITTTFTIKATHKETKYVFYDAKTQKRLRKPFAFSDGEHLYLRVRSLFKHLNRTDKGKQLKDDGNYYTKSIMLGERYHYYENYFTSTAAAIWGGAIATAAARRVKGLIYDIEYQEFNIFRNAKDFKQFVDKKHATHSKDILLNEKNKPVEDLEIVRKIIKEVL